MSFYNIYPESKQAVTMFSETTWQILFPRWKEFRGCGSKQNKAKNKGSQWNIHEWNVKGKEIRSNEGTHANRANFIFIYLWQFWNY